MPQNQPWYPRHPKDELSGPTMVLTCEEKGFLGCLRDWSWVNGGIPDQEEILRNLAKSFLLSTYKFKKLWPRLRNFFEVRDGLLYYPEDEMERRTRVEIIAKRKLSGELGAFTRWGNRDQDSRVDVQTTVDHDSKCHFETMANDSQPPPQPQPHRTVGEPPPPPTPSSEQVGGGGAPPDQSSEPPGQQIQVSLSDQDFHAICQRTISLGMAAPSRSLASRVRAKFGGKTITELVQTLIRWEGQKHAGLWDDKKPEDFELEFWRQQNGGRKPNARDEQIRRAGEVAAETFERIRQRKRVTNA
jgi:hypothetical protein